METFIGIPGYTILEELGKGGFATVLKVRNDEFGYVRAMRVLHEPILNEKNETYRKFKRECKVLLRLGNGNHPNIIHICRPLLEGTLAMVEMDYINGLDISKYIEREKGFVDVKEVISMASQISGALAYCHEDIYKACMDRDIDHLVDDPNDGSKVLIDDDTRKRLIEKYKVIHNDIHAGNIMRSNNGNYILLDFGLAINGTEVVRSSSRHSNGSPEFKAPEKWNDEKLLTEQSDIYSFGVVLYMLLAGRVPFEYDKDETSPITAEFKLSQAHEKMTPPSIEAFRKERYEQKFEGQLYKRDYPQWLENAIFKCLEKNPDDRFKNGKELYEYIQSHLEKQEVAEEKNDDKKEKPEKRNHDLDNEELTYLIGKNKELKSQNTELFNAYNKINKEKTVIKDELDMVKDELGREKEAYKFLKKQYERLNPIAYKILISVFVIFTIVAFALVALKSNTVAEQSSTIHELNNAIDVRENRIKSCERQVKEFQSVDNQQNEVLKTQNDSILESNASLKKKNAYLNNRINNLNDTISVLRNEVHRKDLDVKERDKSINNLYEQIDKLNRQNNY